MVNEVINDFENPKRDDTIIPLHWFGDTDKSIHLSHVIYKGTCICGQTYIGETARNLEVRVNEYSDVHKQSEQAKHIRKLPKQEFSCDVLTNAHSWL